MENMKRTFILWCELSVETKLLKQFKGRITKMNTSTNLELDIINSTSHGLLLQIFHCLCDRTVQHGMETISRKAKAETRAKYKTGKVV